MSFSSKTRKHVLLMFLLPTGLCLTPAVQAGGDPSIVRDGSEPAQGVFFYG